jgi:hypothetical protein
VTEHLVAGDHHLPSLRERADFGIVTPRRFLDLTSG